MASKITEEMFSKALELKESGMAVRAIARSLNVEREALRWRFGKEGGTPDKTSNISTIDGVYVIPVDKSCAFTCHIKGGSISDKSKQYLSSLPFTVYIYEIDLGEKVKKSNTDTLAELPKNCIVVESAVSSLGSVKILNLKGQRKSSRHILNSEYTCIIPRPNLDTTPSASPIEDDVHYTIHTGSITDKKGLYKATHVGYDYEQEHMLPAILVYDFEDKSFRHETLATYSDYHMVMGDVHLPKQADIFFDKLATYAFEGAKSVTLHDFIDFGEIGHHRYRAQNLKHFDVDSYLTSIKKLIYRTAAASADMDLVVVQSNHDTHFRTGLLMQNPQNLPIEERKLFFQLGAVAHEYPHLNEIQVFMKFLDVDQAVYDKFTYVDSFDQHLVGQYKLQFHGHEGINGARFGMSSLSKTNMKLVSAHTHAAMRSRNVISVGMNTQKKMGYNRGFGTWDNVDVIVYVDNNGDSHASHILPARV
jgi:hypothetical protein